jgi:hypothetical protein
MNIDIKVKALSRSKPIVAHREFELSRPVRTANELVEEIVRKNVLEYNKKPIDRPLFEYFSESHLADAARTGKVGFDDRKNEKNQDPDKAVENALQSFEDGIFKMFIGGREIMFGEGIDLKEGEEITFLRLTMLSGRLW